LPATSGRMRYVYPLSLGGNHDDKLEDFAIRVSATDTRGRLSGVETPGYAAHVDGDDAHVAASFSAQGFAAGDDFVAAYRREASDDAELSAYVPQWGKREGLGLDDAARDLSGPGYFALRLVADAPSDAPMSPASPHDRVVVVDVSHGQSP